MYEIKNTIFGICISLLLIGFFLKLTPEGKLSKSVKYLLSMVVLLVVLTPIKGGFEIDLRDINADFNSYNYSQKTYEEKVVTSAITLIKEDVEDFLQKEKFGFYSIEISTVKTDDATEIREIIVNIKSGFAPSAIEEAVSKEFGIPCRAIIGER